jgi:hypothetical protein
MERVLLFPFGIFDMLLFPSNQFAPGCKESSSEKRLKRSREVYSLLQLSMAFLVRQYCSFIVPNSLAVAGTSGLSDCCKGLMGDGGFSVYCTFDFLLFSVCPLCIEARIKALWLSFHYSPSSSASVPRFGLFHISL